MPIWLEVAKSIHQERLAEAERDRLGQEAVSLRIRRNSRKRPVLSQWPRWLAALNEAYARRPRPSMKQIADDRR